jgi:hypothetical protein
VVYSVSTDAKLYHRRGAVHNGLSTEKQAFKAKNALFYSSLCAGAISVPNDSVRGTN